MRQLPRTALPGFAAWLMIVSLAILGAAVVVLAGATVVQAQVSPPDDGRQVLVFLRLPPEHFRADGDYHGAYGGGQAAAARERIASRLAREHGLVRVTNWPMPVVGVDCFVMAAPDGRSGTVLAELLARDPAVVWAEPMATYRGRADTGARTDSLYRLQPAAREWRLAELHQIATGRHVRVAVIDSMIDRSHPGLLGQVPVAENFVTGRPALPEEHGTGVAGIIAARMSNGEGIIGVAPHAELMGLRACWQTSGHGPDPPPTVCDTLSLAKALVFAIDHRAEVVNLSLSGPPDVLLGKLLDAVLARGATVVAAYDADLPGGGFPASHVGVVPVSDGSPPPARPGVFVAPGLDVPTTEPGGRWFLVNGSSYAAAHVSGLFALLRERNDQARGASALVAAASGPGIDACGTLIRAFGPCQCSCAHPADASAIVR
jgi:subtilisin family serine protease